MILFLQKIEIMRNSRPQLNTLKNKKPKYVNMNWVTIPPTIFHHSPRLKDNIQIQKKREAQLIRIKNKPFFENSNISFTKDEIEMLKEADSSDVNSYLPVSRNPSRLEQLQFQKFEENESVGSKKSAQKTIKPKTQLIYERSDSVISLKPLDLSEDDDSDMEPNNETSSQSSKLSKSSKSSNTAKNKVNISIFDTESVTINDIKQHVWIYCHDKDKKEVKENENVRLFPVIFEHPRDSSGNITVHPILSRGERKLKKIAKMTSKIEQEKEESRQKLELEKLQRREKFEQSYCAYKYQKYLYQRRCDIPDFLDEVDFSKSKNTVKKVMRQRLRKEHQSHLDTPRKALRKIAKE